MATSIIKGGMTTRSFTKTTTVSALGTKKETFDVTLDGYTPIGIVGHDAPHSRIIASGIGIENGDSAYLVMVNTFNGELTGLSRVVILYEPS